MKVVVVGGGLAGCEAAWQCLRAGYRVELKEMRPSTSTPAHKTGDLAELVCSNSFKALDPATTSGQLKAEMAAMDSLIVRAAKEAAVPAGGALAVERSVFSKTIEEQLNSFGDRFQRTAEEVSCLPSETDMQENDEVWILATGPLTSAQLEPSIKALCHDEKSFYFYDSIAPIVDADSIDQSKGFWKNRYDKGSPDYYNIPLDKEQYETLISEIKAAEYAPTHNFEDPVYFEACLPIEVMIERGDQTLRFGPLKPVGLTPNDAKEGQKPYAVIQLRQENPQGSMLSMVGFQTKMKWPEQKRIFRTLPGFEQAEFHRMGSVHRNSYLHSPKVLRPNLSFRDHSRLFAAGQMTGVEGYTESAAIGLLAGRSAAATLRGEGFQGPPVECFLGALLDYVTTGIKGDFAPMNANFGLLPAIERRPKESKKDKKLRHLKRAQEAHEAYMRSMALSPGSVLPSRNSSEAPPPVET